MSDERLSSTQRVEDAARRLNLPIKVLTMAEPTRTAQEAATACNCDVAQIVKSLVFTGAESGAPYLILVSGANRVDETGMVATLGEALARPNGNAVRKITGFAIGGIPPFGHAEPLTTLMDTALLEQRTVWAAAGTPFSLFEVDPRDLAAAVGARIVTVAAD